MRTVTFTAEEYAALNSVIAYTLENEAEDFEQNDAEFGNHVYLDAGTVADALCRNEEGSRG